ncbi:MAG: hypothetical protein M3Q48_11090 [Actinomycetota bacterium]|nr:hypothetical protein [Actinomycetota bacterium]
MGTDVVLAHTGTGSSWTWGAWAWLVVPWVVYGLISLALFGFGRVDDPNPVKLFFRSISDSLQRATGFAGWAMAGVLSGLLSLLVAVIGFYWDVAWHIDQGRDTELFTPAHTMILVGLGGLVYSALLTILFATLDEAPVGVRAGPLRIPRSSLVLLALGVGGVTAFPLDNLWHEAYGLDVTLWSPTHLQLVAGGALSTIALWLMCAEALPFARPTLLGRSIHVLTAGTVLVGLTTFEGEFDFGVPQFQVLYLPVLVALAAAFTLVATRAALGPWGAVKVVAVYLALRGVIAFTVGVGFGRTVPRFPLYLASALLVEAVAWTVGTRRRFRFALVAGAVVGTVGLAGELAWVEVSGWGESSPALLAKVAVLGPLAAVGAALLGAGLARAFTAGEERVPLAALVAAGVVVIAVVAYPLPRRVGTVDAVIRLEPAGEQAVVEVRLEPPDAARRATAFVVTSWQGGGRQSEPLDEVAPGLYRTSGSVPIAGRWKSMVTLQRGDQVMAAPVYLPADPEIGASAVPAVPERRERFVRNTTVLLREAHDGPSWPALVAYSGLGGVVALWVALMAVTARRAPFGRPESPDEEPAARWQPRTLVATGSSSSG